MFAALLDRGAGAFRLGPAELRAPIARRYVPGSNVLETSWMTDHRLDGRPRRARTRSRVDEDGEDVRARGIGALDAQHMLVRTVECVHGTIEVEAICEPAFDYATEAASWSLVDKDGLAADASGGGETLRLARRHPARARTAGSPAARARSTPASAPSCACTWREELSGPTDVADAVELIEETVNLWRRWLERGNFPDHPWRWTLQRSALVLKGLTYEPTGGDGRRR